MLTFGFQIEAEKGAPDLAVVQRRIKDIVGVLENFSARRSDSLSRGDYIQQVIVSFCFFYDAYCLLPFKKCFINIFCLVVVEARPGHVLWVQ